MADSSGERHKPNQFDSSPRSYEAEEYESESEGTSALALRRREASDDDEDDNEQDEHFKGRPFSDHESGHRHSYSDADSGAEGAPPGDDEEQEEEDEEEEEEEEDEGFASRRFHLRRGKERVEDDEIEDEIDGDNSDEGEIEENDISNVVEDDGDRTGYKTKEVANEDGGGKKELEPYVVPTAGAFYMHDDRFRESGSARPRRGPGGRKLWEAKDDKRWVHDMFEEIDIGNDGEGFRRGRTGTRGRGRGRGRGQSRDRGWGRGRGRGQGQGLGRERVNGTNTFDNQNSTAAHDVNARDGNYKSAVTMLPKEEDNSMLCQEEEKSKVSISSAQGNVGSGAIEKHLSPSTVQTETAVPKRLISSSILKPSSPPFYPSGRVQPLVGNVSSSEAIGVTSSVGKVTKVLPAQKVAAASAMFIPKPSTQRGKVPSSADKSKVFSESSPGTSSFQQAQARGQPDIQSPPSNLAEGLNTEGKPGRYQGSSQVADLLPVTEPLTAVVAPRLEVGQSSMRFSTTSRPQEQISSLLQSQRQGQASGSSLHRSDGGVLDSGSSQPSVNRESKGFEAARAGGGMQNAKATAYSRVSAGGVSNVLIGEQMYAPVRAMAPGTPLAVPVQYTGQSQGGLGAPGMGVALPNFGGQQQYSFGNSEITWVPVLAGGGGLGFGSPYVAMEGAPPTIFYAQPSVQSSAFQNPRGDQNPSKSTSATWTSQIPHSASEEFEHRQNKPRRYSEMSFGH